MQNEPSSVLSGTAVGSVLSAVTSFRTRPRAGSNEKQDLLDPTTRQIEELAPIQFPHYVLDEYQMPGSIPDLVDDILLYTFSFLPYQDLMHVEQVCTRWRRLASDEVLWKREYLRINGQTTQTTEYRKLFFAKSYRRGFIRHARKQTAIFSTIQTVLVWLYGFFAPLAYLICILLLCINVPLMADGVLTNITSVSTPTVIMLFAFLITALGLLFDPGYISRAKSRYIDYLIQQKQMNDPEENPENQFVNYQRSYTLDKKLDDGWTMSLNMLVWESSLVPIFIMTFLNKMPNQTYLQAFWPMYLYIALYATLPLFFMLVKYRTLQKFDSDNRYLLAYVVFHTNAFNLLLLIQMILVGCKLDGIMQTTWVITCVPVWIVMAVILCFCQVMGITTTLLGKAKDTVNSALCCLQPVLLPIIPWSVLVILKMDNVVNMTYAEAFIPIYVTISFMMCCLVCFVGVCCLPLRVFFNSVSIAQVDADVTEEEEQTQTEENAV